MWGGIPNPGPAGCAACNRLELTRCVRGPWRRHSASVGIVASLAHTSASQTNLAMLAAATAPDRGPALAGAEALAPPGEHSTQYESHRSSAASPMAGHCGSIAVWAHTGAHGGVVGRG